MIMKFRVFPTVVLNSEFSYLLGQLHLLGELFDQEQVPALVLVLESVVEKVQTLGDSATARSIRHRNFKQLAFLDTYYLVTAHTFPARNHLQIYFQTFGKLRQAVQIYELNLWSSGEVVTSPPLNRKVGCSRPTMICARCLRARQHYPAQKNNQKKCSYAGAQQRFSVTSCTARMFVLSIVDKWS